MGQARHSNRVNKAELLPQKHEAKANAIAFAVCSCTGKRKAQRRSGDEKKGRLVLRHHFDSKL